MSESPCQNRSCSSYGKPHPNCKCSPEEMAEGGEVTGVKFDDLKADAPVSFDDLKSDAPATLPSFDDLKADKPLPGGVDYGEADLADHPADAELQEAPEGQPGDLSIPSSLSDAATRAAGKGVFRTPDSEAMDGHKLTDQEIQQKGAEFEDDAALASLATGTGAVGLANKASGAAANYAKLGAKGTAALKNCVATGLISGHDDTAKALLGQGNPEDAVSPYLSMGAMCLFGGLVGAAGSKIAETAVNKMEGPYLKRAANAEKILAGLGLAAEGKALPKGADAAVRAGHELVKGEIAGRAAERVGRALGDASGIPGGRYVASMATRGILKPLLGKAADKVNQYTMPTVLRWLQNGAQGSVMNMIEYADKVAKGTSLINNSIDALFKVGAVKFPEVAAGEVEKLRNYQDEGGLESSVQDEVSSQHDEPQMMAEGGKVEKKPKATGIHDDHAHIADNMPEQNQLIQTAKGRVSNYLSSMRPQLHTPKLVFDDEPDNREQKKNYDKALEVAVNPLSVVGHVGTGTIDPDHVKHLTSMYPELTSHLQKKITERILKDQVDGKKPSYKVRQGLSMIMGTPLSGEMTPTNIQAAQAVFSGAKQKKPPAPGAGSGGPQTKRSSASLSKSDQAYMTDDQARMKRQQRG